MKSVFSRPFSAAGPPQDHSEPNRRFVLKGLLLVGAATMLKPTELLAVQDPAAAWRRMVCDLANTVCSGPVAQRIGSLVWGATAYWTQSSTQLHDSYRAAFFLDVAIQPYSTIYGSRYLEFDRYPFYDSHQPCRRIKDVNEMELRRFLNPEEQKIYNCVVSPCSERRALEYACQLDDFKQTARAYRTDPDAWEHLYVRNVTDGQKSYYAHAVKPRTSNGQQGVKQVFLSPNSL